MGFSKEDLVTRTRAVILTRELIESVKIVQRQVPAPANMGITVESDVGFISDRTTGPIHQVQVNISNYDGRSVGRKSSRLNVL